jgi:hypothetical protein
MLNSFELMALRKEARQLEKQCPAVQDGGASLGGNGPGDGRITGPHARLLLVGA